MIEIKRALISCWDKTNLEHLVKKLIDYDIEIISSGGTAEYLKSHKLPITTVEDITGYPPVLDGRVKTLHPQVHASILAKSTPEHLDDLRAIDAAPIQLVVVNLYPFVEEAVNKELSIDEAIEYIDIGGPALLRAAAKNFQNVVSIFHPEQYPHLLELLDQNNGKVPEEYSQQKSGKIFFYTSWYDSQVHRFLAIRNAIQTSFPQYQVYFLEKASDLRYGENPHQQAAIYRPYSTSLRGMSAAHQLWGKALSFNNYVDVNAAYALALELNEPAVAIIKHTNPCGAAISQKNLSDAFEKAFRGDSLSAFGGIVACNQPVDTDTAQQMSKIFFECIIAPEFEEDALAILKKKKNLRLFQLDPTTFWGDDRIFKPISGSFLIQEDDRLIEDQTDWKVVTEKSPTSEHWTDLAFSWKVVKHVKSNAIVLAKNQELYGVGAGQMSRVDSVQIATMKARQANRELNGLVLASDAFFPFRDGIDRAVAAGVTAIIQPGGSIRDEEVIEAANDHQVSMVFTGTRHFKH